MHEKGIPCVLLFLKAITDLVHCSGRSEQYKRIREITDIILRVLTPMKIFVGILTMYVGVKQPLHVRCMFRPSLRPSSGVRMQSTGRNM